MIGGGVRTRVTPRIPDMTRYFVYSASAACIILVGGCAGGEKPPWDTTRVAVDTSAASSTTEATTPSVTSAPSGATASASGFSAGDQITPQLIALGDSIFHGRAAGGTCQSCHGLDAKGTTVAPNLTDNQWLNGDGSYQFIVNTVTNGVPKPKQHPGAMPPKGGAPLTPDQVTAVAAYVYSLSHPAPR